MLLATDSQWYETDVTGSPRVRMMPQSAITEHSILRTKLVRQLNKYIRDSENAIFQSRVVFSVGLEWIVELAFASKAFGKIEIAQTCNQVIGLRKVTLSNQSEHPPTLNLMVCRTLSERGWLKLDFEN